MRNKSKRKQKTKPKQISKNPIKPETEVDADNIIRLKITVRKGARIESVPIKKLEKLATKNRKQWEIEGEWLILTAI